MQNLFLGCGKVVQAMAKVLEGEKIALEERASELFQLEFENGKWREIHKYTGGLDEFDFSKIAFDRVILSPGIDPRREFYKKIQDREERELDLFCDRFEGKTIVITGTNGKSTFTNQLGFLFRSILRADQVFVGGNLEPAAFEMFSDGKKYDWAILEVSSFQAERLKRARFDYGFILNLGKDHADRYDSLEDYHQAKWNLLKHSNQVIYPKTYSFHKPSLVPNFEESTPKADLYGMFFDQIRKMEDVPEPQSKIYESLPVLPHRLESVYAKNGVLWINDSKATNVESTLYALKQYEANLSKIVLLLGGKDKGDEFKRLLPWVSKLKSIIFFGGAGEKIRSELGQGNANYFPRLKNACEYLIGRVSGGDQILLSPACASFDEFKNYEDRGIHFKEFAQSGKWPT